MKRRTFLKSVVAVIAMPGIPVLRTKPEAIFTAKSPFEIRDFTDLEWLKMKMNTDTEDAYKIKTIKMKKNKTTTIRILPNL